MRDSVATLNIQADNTTVLLNSGFVKFYDGVQPVSPETAITTQNMLCSITFDATAFSVASGGISAIPAPINGLITTGGTTTWARLFKTDDTTVVADATVGGASSGKDIELETIVLALDDILQLDTLLYTRPAV